MLILFEKTGQKVFQKKFGSHWILWKNIISNDRNTWHFRLVIRKTDCQIWNFSAVPKQIDSFDCLVNDVRKKGQNFKNRRNNKKSNCKMLKLLLIEKQKVERKNVENEKIENLKIENKRNNIIYNLKYNSVLPT
jgi:hypothetical protein